MLVLLTALSQDLVQLHGRLPLSRVLQPAADLAREGFPVGPLTAQQWARGRLQGDEAKAVLLPHGRAPLAGEIFTNPDLADTFELLGREGAKRGFYEGRIAAAIVSAVREFGGLLSEEDLRTHRTTFLAPLSTVYRGVRVYEPPAPTHGVAALEALGILAELEATDESSSKGQGRGKGRGRESDYDTHLAVECMRLAFADALQYVCDGQQDESSSSNSSSSSGGVARLLDPLYLRERAKKVNRRRASEVFCGDPDRDPDADALAAYAAGETVYFCVVDGAGNACSFINSNYMGFGSGIVPAGTGFTLHNRGHNFSLQLGHPNQVIQAAHSCTCRPHCLWLVSSLADRPE